MARLVALRSRVAILCTLAAMVVGSSAQDPTPDTTTTTTTTTMTPLVVPNSSTTSQSPVPSLPPTDVPQAGSSSPAAATDSSSSSSISSTTTTSTTSTTTLAPSTSSSTTSSTTSLSSTSTSSPYPSTSSIPSAPLPSSSASSANAATADELMPLYRPSDPQFTRTVAAIVSGCGMFLLMLIMFIIISLIVRYRIRSERQKIVKDTRRKSLAPGDGQFYSGLEPYSAQALVSSLSGTSFGASDVHLDAQGGRGVFHNRGFEEHHGEEMVRGGPIASTSSAGSDGHFEESYKPIEIKSKTQNDQSTV